MSRDPEFPNGMCIKPKKWSKVELRRIKALVAQLRKGNKTIRLINRLKIQGNLTKIETDGQD